MDRYLKARLDAIDAANMCIMERQTAIFGFIGALDVEDGESVQKAFDDMNRAADKYIEKIGKINEELQDGKHTESA